MSTERRVNLRETDVRQATCLFGPSCGWVQQTTLFVPLWSTSPPVLWADMSSNVTWEHVQYSGQELLKRLRGGTSVTSEHVWCWDACSLVYTALWFTSACFYLYISPAICVLRLISKNVWHLNRPSIDWALVRRKSPDHSNKLHTLTVSFHRRTWDQGWKCWSEIKLGNQNKVFRIPVYSQRLSISTSVWVSSLRSPRSPQRRSVKLPGIKVRGFKYTQYDFFSYWSCDPTNLDVVELLYV